MIICKARRALSHCHQWSRDRRGSCASPGRSSRFLWSSQQNLLFSRKTANRQMAGSSLWLRSRWCEMGIKLMWSEREVVTKRVAISPRDVLVSPCLWLRPSCRVSLTFRSQAGEFGSIWHLVSWSMCHVPVLSCSSCLGVLCCRDTSARLCPSVSLPQTLKLRVLGENRVAWAEAAGTSAGLWAESWVESCEK